MKLTIFYTALLATVQAQILSDITAGESLTLQRMLKHQLMSQGVGGVASTLAGAFSTATNGAVSVGNVVTSGISSELCKIASETDCVVQEPGEHYRQRLAVLFLLATSSLPVLA